MGPPPTTPRQQAAWGPAPGLHWRGGFRGFLLAAAVFALLPETDSEKWLCMQKVYSAVLSGVTCVRQHEKHDPAEGEAQPLQRPQPSPQALEPARSFGAVLP